MKLNLQTDGLCLPVSKNLVELLSHQTDIAEVSGNIDSLTFNFRDKSYSPENGGYHPVEIRIARENDNYRLEYITSFSYVGNGQDCELAVDTNFDFIWGKCEVQYMQPTDLADAASFYKLFEGNFIDYVEMGAFNEITVTPD